jgi:hypothetical protein
MILLGDSTRTQRKIGPSATLSTINTTWTDLGTNLDLCGDRPAINCLSHGMATYCVNNWIKFLYNCIYTSNRVKGSIQVTATGK